MSLKQTELIESLVAQGVEDFLIFEPRQSFDKGCIGYDKEHNKLIYDYELLVEALGKDWENDYPTSDDAKVAAMEWLDFNTLRTLDYVDNAPKVRLFDWETETSFFYGEE